MGLIIKNSVAYSGGGGGSANIVELTKAEYDALPESKNTDNTMYLLKDVDPEGGGGGNGIIEITQAEYDALPEEKKLNGAYYITDASDGMTVAEVASKVAALSAIIDGDLKEKVDTIYESVGITDYGKVLLWENPDISSSFAPQTIDVDSTGYRYVLVTCLVYSEYEINETNVGNTLIEKNGSTVGSDMPKRLSTAYHYEFSRKITNITDNTITFAQGEDVNYTQNKSCIPYKIYGIGKIGE